MTEAKGICSGETDEKVEPDEVTIRQEGVTLTVTGLNATDPAWQGEIVGNTVTFGGERDEDRGPTTALFILTVDDDCNDARRHRRMGLDRSRRELSRQPE